MKRALFLMLILGAGLVGCGKADAPTEQPAPATTPPAAGAPGQQADSNAQLSVNPDYKPPASK